MKKFFTLWRKQTANPNIYIKKQIYAIQSMTCNRKKLLQPMSHNAIGENDVG